MAIADVLVGTKELVDLFGISSRRIEQLRAEGIIESEGKPARYKLVPTLKRYIKYLSDKANGREKKQTTAQQEEEKLKAEVRIKKAKAETAELELDELQGKMHRAEDVEAIVTGHVYEVRSMLMAMPGKLAIDLAALNTPAEVSERVRQEVYYILEHLSTAEYNPEEYRRRVLERQGWNTQQEGEDVTPDDE